MQPNHSLRQILLIDDDLEICHLLTDLLAGSNYHLTSLNNPHEGLRFALTSTQVDLILLDIDMPELDGLEILKQLKHTQAGKTPVIMLTAHSDLQSVQEAIQLGAEGYLLKPFRLQHFADALKRIFKEDYLTLSFTETHSNPSPTIVSETIKTHRILVIDDQEQFHFLIQEILEKSIASVMSCFNGRDALDHIKSSRPNLVLLDLYLPDIDSIHVLREIRKTAPDLPVLVMVSDINNDKLEQVRQLNIQGYILRSSKYYSLVSQLERELGTALFPEKT